MANEKFEIKDEVQVHLCKVVDVDDKSDCFLIKVEMKGSDDVGLSKAGSDPTSKEYLDSLPWASPLMPKFIHIRPKVNDYVLVFTGTLGDKNSQRYYIGPVFARLSDTFNTGTLGAAEGLQGSVIGEPREECQETKGAVPNYNDICLLGRKNCELQIGEDDVRLKAGVKKFVSDNDFVYNTRENGSFIKLKYSDDGFDYNNETIHSTATIIADKINLIGGDKSGRGFDLFSSETTTNSVSDPNREDLLPDSEMVKLLSAAHMLPYGDILVEYLRLFSNAFCKHTHKWVGPGEACQPVHSDTYNAFENFGDLNKILCDNVRII